ncbi:MAG: MG2 domain-containing protein, partial [Planctomycetia bacterium]
MHATGTADEPRGSRGSTWKSIEQALQEGKPKTAIEALTGIELTATQEKAWDEAARAIATRIFAATGDRPADDPERVIRLAAAIEKAPPETRGVLEAIRANWTWGYFQVNRWRYQQRTQGSVLLPQGGADSKDLAKLAEWDLPTIVAEIRKRFAVAVGAPGSPERAALQKLPAAEWSAIIEKGTMADSYRPTVWDVIVRDAIEFAGTGERGLMAPEDAFEITADSRALGTPEEFLAWQPERDKTVTDTDSPLLDTVRLYRDLLDFHKADADRTAFLAADLDRILWAINAVVAAGEPGDLFDRKEAALSGFIGRAGDHETAAIGRFHLASLVQQGDGQGGAGEPGDMVEARKIAMAGAEAHPKSPGGAMCKNLVVQIESRELSLVTESTWAAPWPVVRVSYRNLAKVHLRLAKADFLGRLKAGKPHGHWIDDADRKAILSLPAVKEHAADLPATDDYRQRHHDIQVAAALETASLEPGDYWVIASHTPDFGDKDNVVFVSLVRVTDLSIVAEQQSAVVAADGARGAVQGGPVALAGHVVNVASGEPVAGAMVKLFVRGEQGNPPLFAEAGTATTDTAGRYELSAPQQKEIVVDATADLGGTRHATATDSTHVWRQERPAGTKSLVLVTDRGIHRPGQIVHYKGIACASDFEKADSRAVADRQIEVTFRDANGREIAKATHTTTANGSFHGNFPIATGALPGQWSIQAQAPGNDGFGGGVAVRVEEYKRPKFLVKLAAPEKSPPLGGEVSLSGTATTYPGLPVSGAKVKWNVERQVRWPIWCRWFFPWLPFDSGSQRIAHGTSVTDDSGTFTVRFTAGPDRTVPKESLPVFTFAVVADVTDSSGETRSDTRSVSVGYADVDASVSAAEWLAVIPGEAAAVKLTVGTTTLDGQPREAAGMLTVSRLVQPAEVARIDLFGGHGGMPRPMRGRRGAAPAGRQPIEPNPADPRAWAVGEAVFTQKVSTDKATGKAEATATLQAGIYKAVFEIPAAGDVPAVRAEQVIEVVDPAAERYGVKRAFVMKAEKQSVEPTSEFAAILGTGYDKGRALVEISQAGKTLARYWTEPGRTQWPVSLKVTHAHRGGFTVRAWMVRDGRLHSESRTIDVPWTNKKLAIEWERFTRRLEPGAKEIWRAKITSVADPVAGPATPVAAEFLALAYDQSLDALAQHAWPGDLMGMFRHESSWSNLAFTNRGEGFNHIRGHFDMPQVNVPDMTYRVLRDPFGTPTIDWGGGFGGRGRRLMARGKAAGMDGVPMVASMAAPMEQKDNELALRGADAERTAGDAQGPGGPAASAPPPPRKNLVETAFFLPSLSSGKDGVVSIEFTLPDTLTTWQFKGLAHDAALRSGTIIDTCVSIKDLMVEPVMPRFLREADVVQIPVKVSNKSTGRLSGSVKFALADARTDADRGGLIDGPRELPFDLAAGESKPVVFTVTVADGTETLRYLATGSAGKAAAGEEAFIPVLPRKVLVSESVPVTIRGPGTRNVSLDRLAKSAGTDIQSQSLVVQATSNPAWYAVLALPSIMEDSDESTETLFTRLYANSLARHLVMSDPRIGKVFEQWKATAALESPLDARRSPLERNADLVKTLLAETPWVRDAVDEKEARARIALLFDTTRAENETQAALTRLATLRNGDGGWPWFPGGRTCDSVTLGIVAGFGRLRAAGVKIDVQPALQTIPWLDGRLVEEKRRAEQLWKDKPDEIVLTPLGVSALDARSFFTADAPPQGEAAAAIQWAFDVGRKCWMKLDARLTQGQLAIALVRSGDKPTALSIIDSLK